MERKEAYEQIKKLGLQEECKKKFGKNFTQCKTNELVYVITRHIGGVKSSADVKKAAKKGTKSTMDVVYSLIETLHSKHILLDSEVKRILS